MLLPFMIKYCFKFKQTFQIWVYWWVTVPNRQDRKYGYAFAKTCMAFTNENIFPSKYLVSNIIVVIISRTTNIMNEKGGGI